MSGWVVVAGLGPGAESLITPEAQAAIDAANGSAMLDQTLEVSFAFSKGPLNK